MMLKLIIHCDFIILIRTVKNVTKTLAATFVVIKINGSHEFEPSADQSDSCRHSDCRQKQNCTPLGSKDYWKKLD